VTLDRDAIWALARTEPSPRMAKKPTMSSWNCCRFWKHITPNHSRSVPLQFPPPPLREDDIATADARGLGQKGVGLCYHEKGGVVFCERETTGNCIDKRCGQNRLEDRTLLSRRRRRATTRGQLPLRSQCRGRSLIRCRIRPRPMHRKEAVHGLSNVCWSFET
jgi:hypothetical protein